MRRQGNRGLGQHLFVWGAISGLVVACLMVIIQSNHASETKESTVNLASESKTERPGIPPIDDAVPPIIETASFGLG